MTNSINQPHQEKYGKNKIKREKEKKRSFQQSNSKKKWRKSIITWNNEERNTHIYTCGGGVELRIHIKLKIIKGKKPFTSRFLQLEFPRLQVHDCLILYSVLL